MKRLTTIFVSALLVANSAQAQLGHLRPRIPDLGLDTLSGDVTVFYHKGYLGHALEVQSNLEQFRTLVEDSLGVTSNDDAVLLTLEDYDAISDLFDYPPGAGFPTLDDLFVMETPPERSFVYTFLYMDHFAVSGAAGDSLDSIASGRGFASRDSVAYWLYNLVPVHEVGHLVTEEFLGGTPGGPVPDHHHKWLNEISAEMLLYAFVTRFSPELMPLYIASVRARMQGSGQPPGQREGMALLKQCDSAYGEIWEDWSGSWCWNWWALKGAAVFDEIGFQFFRDLDELVPWPDAGHPYPSVEEMVAALDAMQERWMIWLPAEADIGVPPGRFKLSQNYPNPFNPTTTITYDVRKTTEIDLILHDITGRTIRTLDSGLRTPDVYAVTLDAAELPSGVYFYRLRAGDFVATRSLILAK